LAVDELVPVLISIYFTICVSAGFIGELNGITRLMVLLGTKQPHSHTHKLFYTHISGTNENVGFGSACDDGNGRRKVGTTCLLDKASFDEIQVMAKVEKYFLCFGLVFLCSFVG
jgi:hypothetical protein